jgi:hypothetical protein
LLVIHRIIFCSLSTATNFTPEFPTYGVGTLEPSRGALKAAYHRLRTGAMFRRKNSEVLAAV